MRPVKLTIKHFGPFAGTEVVDFDKFQNEGLFLINGQTGAGKTSILDAMTFAIFGEVLGLRGKPINQKDAAVRLKSDYADPKATPKVIFEVDINGTLYRFTRSPKFRKPGNTTDTLPTATLEVFDDSEWTALSSNVGEVGSLATQFLGLNKDQFAQLILLPQGGFAAFLNAKNEDKAKLLGDLFPANTYEDVRDWIAAQRAKAKEEIANLDTEQKVLEARFSQATNTENLALSEQILLDFLNGKKSEKEKVEKLIQEKSAALEPLQLKLAGAEASQIAFDAIQGAETEIAGALNELEGLHSKFAVLGVTSPTEALLAEELAKSNSIVVSIQSGIERFDHLENLQEQLSDHLTELDELELANQEAVANLAALENAERLLKEEIDSSPNLEVDKFRTENDVENLTKQKDILQDINQKVTKIEELRRIQIDTDQSYKESLENWSEVLATYQQDLAGFLAGELKANQACLVCGSIEHPQPATPKSGSPSKSDVDKAQKKADETKAKCDSVNIAVETLASTIETLRKQLPDGISIDGLAEKLSSANQSLAELNEKLEIHNGKKLALHNMQEAINVSKQLIQSTAEKVSNSQTAVARLDGVIKQAGEELKGKSRSDFESELNTAKFKSSELTRLIPIFSQQNSAIADAKAVINANKQTAENRVESIEVLRNEVSDAVHLLNQIRADLTRLDDQINGINDIQKKFVDLIQNSGQAKQNEERWANLESYTSGNAGRKIDLPTFYLSYRLKQVLAAANHRLQTMTDGRYTLINDELVAAARGAKGGLAIMVIDANSGQQRGPESLSGGETFMASLALALGLSDIVSAEAGGRRLEALFVDEGFGSLDAETLDQVMDSLDELRAAGRMVGLVSHVESMRSRVPAQIIVKKTNAGSSIQLVGIN